MVFNPPANQDDLSDRPDDRDAFIELWNRNRTPADNRYFYMGDYVTRAARNPNYVDPRVTPPSGLPAPVPWNGFPRLMSRFYDDGSSEAARARADEVADILTPWLYWSPPDGGIESASPHHFRFFAAVANVTEEFLREVARPLHAVNPDGTIGAPIPQFRRQQDEYLEWHVDRNPDDTIRSISLTAEPPDYWQALAEVAPDRVLELYRRHVAEEVQEADLFYPERVAAFGWTANGTGRWVLVPELGGAYNPLNRWTTLDGIMHLTHRANTLGAEVNLAGDASVPRPVDSAPRTPGQSPSPEILRIACGAYGGINRSSDPNIGLDVGDFVRDGNRVTLTDPVGLYIGKVDLAGLLGPNGEALEAVAGKTVRGTEDPFEPRILRYEISLPEGTGYTLSDCTFDNRPLLRGGQIARQTTIQLYANAYPGTADPTEVACERMVCRRPDNAEVFLAGSLAGCPVGDSPYWVLTEPYEGEPAVPEAQNVASEAAATVVETPASLSGAEGRMPPSHANPYKLPGG